MNLMKVWSVLSIVVLAVAAPAAAQSASSADATPPVLGVQYGLLRYNSFNSSKVGFDVNYATRSLTQPMGSLGFRAGVIVEGGVHHFEDGSLSLFTGGLNLTADKIGSERYKPFAHVMFGIGHYPEGTDKVMTLMGGVDIVLQGRPFRLRLEGGQVWEFYDGGHQVPARFSVGIALPLK